MPHTLTLRALNRALLARQLLLERPALQAADAISRVAGLQAQSPSPPFVGLWARLDGFDARELHALIEARDVVRAPLMRHTVHLVTVADYLVLRGPVQRALERSFAAQRKRVTDAELEAAVRIGGELFAARPATFAELRRELEAALPGADHQALAYGVRTHLRLVGVPEPTRWSFNAKAVWRRAEDWLGRAIPDDDDPAELVRRYLRAFGPASAADVQAWSGVPRLLPVLEAMRGELRTFRDDRGRELFDVPDGPLPDPDTPVPLRFTAEWDNALLGFADRRRIVPDEHRRAVFNVTKNGRMPGTFLVDGFVAGRWWVGRERGGREVTLELDPFRRLSRDERAELRAQAEQLLALVASGARARGLRFAPRA